MTKKILFLLMGFLSMENLFSQSESLCGTVTTDEVRAQMLAISRDARLGISTRDSWFYIPIQFHIVGNDDGIGYFETEKVFELICNLNEQFEPLKVRYYIFDEFNYIDNNSYFNHDFSNGYTMMAQNNVMGTVNTYIVADPAGACGYAYYPWGGPPGGGIALKKNCSGPGNSTFAHELGHFFSLPHTFDNWENNPEYVNGTNCQFAGDYFCDTPADRLGYRWNCPYNMNLKDPNDSLYAIDGSLLMSYSLEPCGTRFSQEQQSAMLYSMQYDYNGKLVNHPDPNANLISGIAAQVSPVDGDFLRSNIQLFTWKKAANAQYYHFVIHRLNMPANSRIEVITTDTFFLVDQLKGKMLYEWKVMGFHENSTCAPVARSFFSTEEGVGIENTSSSNPISLFPNPVKPGENLSIAIKNNRGNTQISIYNLHGKKVGQLNINQTGTLLNLKFPELPSGLYFLELSSEKGERYFKKVLVN